MPQPQARDEKAALSILLVASSLTILAGALVSPALPAMKERFADAANVDLLLTLVLTVPGLSIAIAAPIAGLAADKIGRLQVLLIGLILYGLSGASALVLDSLEAIVVGRVVLGLAIGCTMTSATALITDYWDGAQRQKVMGLQAAAIGVGGVCYPLLAGVLTEFGWRTPFLVYLTALALAVWAARKLWEMPRVAEQRAGSTTAGFPVALAAIVFLLGFLAMVVLYAIPLRTPFYLSDLGYPSPTLAALAISLPSLMSVVSALNFGCLRAHLSPEAILGVSFGCMASGYAVVAAVPGMWGLYLGLIVFGAGFGLNGPNLMSWLQSSVPADQRGRAAGGYTTCVFFGQFFSTFVYTTLANVGSFSQTFALVAMVCLAVSLLGWLATASMQRRLVSS
jgi:MFS family permease